MEQIEKYGQIQFSEGFAGDRDIAIVSDIPALHASADAIFMDPHVQITLFGQKRTVVTVAELYDAFEALKGDVAETLCLELDRGDEIGIYNTVNNPIIPRWHVFLKIRRRNGEESFAKVGSADAKYDANKPLREEEAAFRIANEWRYPPTLKLLTPYKETKQGRSLYELQWIDFSKEGFTPYNSIEGRKYLTAKQGADLANIIIPMYRKPIPAHIDISNLRLTEWSLETPQIYFEQFTREQQTILQHEQLIDNLVKDDTRPHERGSDILRRLFQETEEQLWAFVQEAEGDNRIYYAINDLAPHNTLFTNEHGKKRFGSDVVIFYLGLAGKVYNPVLAFMFDCGSAATRGDPNTEYVQSFLRTALNINPVHDLQKSYTLIRCAFIARTIFVAHLSINLSNIKYKRYIETVSKLENLVPNLQQFEKYKKEREKGYSFPIDS